MRQISKPVSDAISEKPELEFSKCHLKCKECKNELQNGPEFKQRNISSKGFEPTSINLCVNTDQSTQISRMNQRILKTCQRCRDKEYQM